MKEIIHELKTQLIFDIDKEIKKFTFEDESITFEKQLLESFLSIENPFFICFTDIKEIIKENTMYETLGNGLLFISSIQNDVQVMKIYNLYENRIQNERKFDHKIRSVETSNSFIAIDCSD